jgi:DNA mismatch repair ATPase MutL
LTESCKAAGSTAEDLERNLEFIPKIVDETIRNSSCKGAIKFNDKISVGTGELVLEDLKNCRDPFFCIHGRPTIYPYTEKPRSLVANYSARLENPILQLTAEFKFAL